MKISLSLRIVLLFLLINVSHQAQTKTNLDVFKVLVDSSITEALVNISDSPKDIYLDLKLGSSYAILEDQIFKSIKAHKKKISLISNPSENIGLGYSIENAVVNYGEIFRDGFLGDHFVERKVFISGSYRFQDKEVKIKDFYLVIIEHIFIKIMPI